MIKIYTFVSEGPTGLLAFAGDSSGSSLPAQHGPWKSVGNIGPHEAIPHGLDRERIEQSIDNYGFQLWRVKKGFDKR